MKGVTKDQIFAILKRQVNYQGCQEPLLERCLTKAKCMAIQHQQVNEESASLVFNLCLETIKEFLAVKKTKDLTKSQKELITFTQGFLRKNNWMIFLDKLSIQEDLNTLHIMLFKTLVLGLILKEKDYKPFWNQQYKELSEKLWSPTETGLVDLHSNFLKTSSKKQVGKSQFFQMKETNLQNKNSLKTYLQSYTSILVDKWADVNTKKNQSNPLKTFVLQVYPNEDQKAMYKKENEGFCYTFNKIHNAVINNKEKVDFRSLRNKHVTYETKTSSDEYTFYTSKINSYVKEKSFLIKFKKSLGDSDDYNESIFLIDSDVNLIDTQIENLKEEKKKALKKIDPIINENITTFERSIAKELRQFAVAKFCDAYKTARANLEKGNIKFFSISPMNGNDTRQCITYSKSRLKISYDTGTPIVTSTVNGKKTIFKINQRTIKRLKKLKIYIDHDCDFVKQAGKYFFHIPIETSGNKKEKINGKFITVDPGIVKIATICTGTKCIEVTHSRRELLNIHSRIGKLKKRKRKKRKRKKHFRIFERKLENKTTSLHWDLIKKLTNLDGVLFFGDIKSASIVKGKKNHLLNKEMNLVKFYKLKQRLVHKCNEKGKHVKLVDERYTSAMCSSCGSLGEVNSRDFKCSKCNLKCDRDINACKNIALKGFLC